MKLTVSFLQLLDQMYKTGKKEEQGICTFFIIKRVQAKNRWWTRERILWDYQHSHIVTGPDVIMYLDPGRTEHDVFARIGSELWRLSSLFFGSGIIFYQREMPFTTIMSLWFLRSCEEGNDRIKFDSEKPCTFVIDPTTIFLGYLTCFSDSSKLNLCNASQFENQMTKLDSDLSVQMI